MSSQCTELCLIEITATAAVRLRLFYSGPIIVKKAHLLKRKVSNVYKNVFYMIFSSYKMRKCKLIMFFLFFSFTAIYIYSAITAKNVVNFKSNNGSQLILGNLGK